MKKNKRSKTVAKADRICVKHATQYRQATRLLSKALYKLDDLEFVMQNYNSDHDLGPGKQEDFTQALAEFKEQIEELLMNNPELL